MSGFGDAREQPPVQAPSDSDDGGRWLIGYRRNTITGTVLLLGFKPPITELLRRKRWAVLVAGEGWSFPARYLAHVEKLLAGMEADLYDLDGALTPAQRERERGEDRGHTRRLLDDIGAARERAEASPVETRRAAVECRRAFVEAIADRRRRDAASAPAEVREPEQSTEEAS